MEILATLHQSSTWELFVVPYNFGHLVIYECKNAIVVVVHEHFFGNNGPHIHFSLCIQIIENIDRCFSLQ